MKTNKLNRVLMLLLLLTASLSLNAQQRRPVDNRHPLWLIHVDVWNKADPQKIIDLVPDDIKPFVCMNLSLSCQYDTEKNVYKMPQNAVKTYKSWASVCQANGLWFTCQPASGGHTHIQDNDLETFEYFFKQYPNFLGWNYAEQFWGFDEANDKSSSSQASRIALFAKLVPMHHKYGGFLTISFCGNIWSHALNPVGMMKRNSSLLNACRQYPDAILWLYKYTTSSCFYNNESVTFSPFISGLAKNYGVRYDNCGWNGALDALLGEGHGKKYPEAAGIGTVMEQTCVNGGAVWDGPELIWTSDFKNLNNSTVSGYTRRNWGTFPGFDNAWIDMFRKIIDGTMYIPSREEVVANTKIAVINDATTGNDENKYAAWGGLYDGLYKQTDPFNRGNGQWMDNFCYFKKTGRYGTIPVCIGLYDDQAKSIPVKVYKSEYATRWTTQSRKVLEFNKYYPEVSTGDLYVNRYKNQLVTYTPYTYMNSKKTASATIPLQYNTCDQLELTWGKLSTGIVHEYADHIDFYLNNYRSDTTAVQLDKIVVKGAVEEPTYTYKKRAQATLSISKEWNEEEHSFTLNVKHNGPIDVTINCAGEGTDRLTDLVPNTPLTAELPKQPEDFYGKIVIEAEDMDYKSIKSCVTDPYNWYPNVRGHAGNGFADMGTNTAGALKHIVNIKHPGDYKIGIRYMNTAKVGRLYTTVNAVRSTLQVEKTANNEWKTVVFDAALKEGNNTFYIMNSNGIAMYIDNIYYRPADVEEEKFKVTVQNSEHGTVTASVEEAAEGEAVTLTVVPDEGYKLAGWNIIHGGITVSDDTYGFTMPDDNVTLQPIFADTTLEYNLDLTDVLTGTLPPGWRCVQENNEVHEYPNSFSYGARTFSGFTGHQGKALYWREVCAEYGRLSGFPLKLEPGDYKLTFCNAAWKESPKYQARILDAEDNVIAESDTYTSAPNVNGNTAGNITSAKNYELEFKIETAGNYIISFINKSNSSVYDEYLLAECKINKINDPTAIDLINGDMATSQPVEIYNLQGIRQNELTKGINIVRMADGKVRKILVK